MQWKKNLTSATQPISSIVIATKGFNVMCKSTVNLDFLILQPKRTRIEKIQQGTKNEVKWK